MSNTPELIDVVHNIYENERGLGFSESDTHITWRNPDPSPDLELGFEPLVLDGVAADGFGLVKARIYVGWAGDSVQFDARTVSSNDRYLRSFADRIHGVYQQHDHTICIRAAETILAARQKSTALFKRRAAIIDGEVIKF